jgi:hypothetical protein
MLTLYIADAEKDVSMKNLSPKEAIAILSDMKIDIPVPKAAVTQIKRNTALDMAISALNCSEIPNNCPAADVVPVVRCKDCKFREEDAFCTGRGFPYQLVPDDGFCDRGKNKNYNTLTRKQRKAD